MLRRLREVMAERESAQARLDKVVMLIASNIVAEVCSLYLQPETVRSSSSHRGPQPTRAQSTLLI